MRCHDRSLGPQAAHGFRRCRLVAGVGVGMEIGNRHRRHPLFSKVIQNGGQARQVQRPHFDAAIAHPAGQFAPQVPRDEGFGLLIAQVEEIGPVATGDLQRITETFGGDQTNLDTLAFGQGVDDDRCSVNEEIDLRRINLPLLQHVQHAHLEIRRRGVGFCGDDANGTCGVVGLEGHHIGKGASHISGNANGL